MEGMRTPWLDIQNQLKSAGAFAELQNTGFALSRFSAYDDKLSVQLRSSLGDWRGEIWWPTEIFDDALKRRAFYVERDLDVRLTDFPTTALLEGLSSAGISTLSALESEISAEGNLQEVELFRRKQCRRHDVLQFRNPSSRFH